MQRILISACLLGERVRYDGNANSATHPYLEQWQQTNRLVSLCPEMAGGLPTPRTPAEIIQTSGQEVLDGHAQVRTQNGVDVTDAFLAGAQHALAVAQKYDCRFALLAARSPSCGNEQIYSGEFNGRLVSGAGVTAQLLKNHGIEVFNQNQIEQLHSRMQGHL